MYPGDGMYIKTAVQNFKKIRSQKSMKKQYVFKDDFKMIPSARIRKIDKSHMRNRKKKYFKIILKSL